MSATGLKLDNDCECPDTQRIPQATTMDPSLLLKYKEFEDDCKFLFERKKAARERIDQDWKKLSVRDKGFKSFAERSDKQEITTFLEWEIQRLANKKKGARRYLFASIASHSLAAILIAGIFLVLLLVVFSVVCGTGFCGSEDRILEDNGLTVQRVPVNVPLQIITSPFVLTLLAAVIGPLAIKFIKEKNDIQIEESEVRTIMADALKAVRIYQNEADRLRDSTGRIPNTFVYELKDLAFMSMKDNYGDSRYNYIAKNIGVEVFGNAITEAVRRNWIEDFPAERALVKEIIRQSIDAFPPIVDWVENDPPIRRIFLAGHVKRLLYELNVEGWVYEQLRELFDEERNKRLMAAEILKEMALLNNLPKTKDHLKYAGGAFDIALAQKRCCQMVAELLVEKQSKGEDTKSKPEQSP